MSTRDRNAARYRLEGGLAFWRELAELLQQLLMGEGK
jgi:hypothetical protein